MKEPRRNTGAKRATYRGRQYHSYSELARELMPLTGRTYAAIQSIISKYGGDGDAVLRYCQTHRRHRQARGQQT